MEVKGWRKRKGYRREARSEGSVEQTCESMDKNRVQGASVGRAGDLPRSPYPSRMRSVDPATVHGKRLNIQLRLDFSSAPTGEARQAGREDIESPSVMSEPERPANTSRIMEEVCERANLKEALRQVRGNKGSAGVDRMTVDQLGGYLKQHWLSIREQLLNGTYEPKPVRRVEIPKPDGGGVRKLGIPTVLDRFVQQALCPASGDAGSA